MKIRIVVATVQRRHGAWLISLTGPAADDLTPIETFDAASSLAKAKAVGRQMVEDTDYEPLPRWTKRRADWWQLEAFWDDGTDQPYCPRCRGRLMFDGIEGYVCEECGDEWEAGTIEDDNASDRLIGDGPAAEVVVDDVERHDRTTQTRVRYIPKDQKETP